MIAYTDRLAQNCHDAQTEIVRLRAMILGQDAAALTVNILRHWDREQIVRFAKHLLGDECEACPKHESKEGREDERYTEGGCMGAETRFEVL
jgi:hypothetical protein